jgi:nucleoside-diphosphate-sugar epimerase
MTRLLVTGATGEAGRFITKALLESGFSIRAQFNRTPGTLHGVEWVQHNFLESLEVGPLVDRCDGVVHLAAALSAQDQMDRLNVDATAALAKAAAAAGAKAFAHASSIVVYGSPLRQDVTEETPLIDPTKPIEKQYFAEPYMRDYARTKVLGELALRALDLKLAVVLLRPGVVADGARLVESRDWSKARKLFALYRRTQYIAAADAAAAVVHLLRRALNGPPGVDAFNIVDETAGNFRDLHRAAFAATGDARFKPGFDVPVALDMAKDFARFKTLPVRYPLGMLRFSSAKLRASGFTPPLGFNDALRAALAVLSAPG